jgi:hypothetical protein
VDTSRVKRLFLSAREQGCAYRLWVNGVPSIECGKVGTDRASETPEIGYHSAEFDVAAPEIDLLLQVSNFRGAEGGMRFPLRCTAPRSGARSFRTQLFTQSLCLSVILLLGLFYLVIYSRNRAQTHFLTNIIIDYATLDQAA